jgi:hypothetical protein
MIAWLECHKCRLFDTPFAVFFYSSGILTGWACHALAIWWRRPDRWRVLLHGG